MITPYPYSLEEWGRPLPSEAVKSDRPCTTGSFNNFMASYEYGILFLESFGVLWVTLVNFSHATFLHTGAGGVLVGGASLLNLKVLKVLTVSVLLLPMSFSAGPHGRRARPFKSSKQVYSLAPTLVQTLFCGGDLFVYWCLMFHI